MSDGFSIEIDDMRAIAQFDGLPREVMMALERKCGGLSLQLEAKVKGKLSGDVLNVRTGALRRSIFSDVSIEGDVVSSYVASSGDVPYAGIHEFGFDGIEHVKGHVREITRAFGQSLKDAIMAEVRPFDRHMKMPERSYLRSSLAEMAPEIFSELQDAVSGALAR